MSYDEAWELDRINGETESADYVLDKKALERLTRERYVVDL